MYSDIDSDDYVDQNREDAPSPSPSLPAAVELYQNNLKKIRVLEHFLRVVKIADGRRLCIILCPDKVAAQDGETSRTKLIMKI